MSDFSGMEQSFALAALSPEEGTRELHVPLPATVVRPEISPDEVWLQQLTTAREIAGIEHLRRQIQLPAAVLADPGFASLEKKETKSAASRHCSGVTSPSAR
jgi:hypothetical protein